MHGDTASPNRLECFCCFLSAWSRAAAARDIAQLAKRGQAGASALSGLALIINRVQNEFMERNSPPAIVLLEQCLKLHVTDGEKAAHKHLYGVLSGQNRVRASPPFIVNFGRGRRVLCSAFVRSGSSGVLAECCVVHGELRGWCWVPRLRHTGRASLVYDDGVGREGFGAQPSNGDWADLLGEI